MIVDDIIGIALLFAVLVLSFVLFVQNVSYNEKVLSQELLQVRLRGAAHEALQTLLFSQVEGKQYGILLSAALSTGNKKVMVNDKEIDVELEADRFLSAHYTNYAFSGKCGNNTITIEKIGNASTIISESIEFPCAHGNATVMISVGG